MYFNAGLSIRTGRLDYELYQHSHVGFYNRRGDNQTLLGLSQYTVLLTRTDLAAEYKVALTINQIWDILLLL